MRRSILKNSLKLMYADCPEILEALDLIDWSAADRKFYAEVFHHMPETEFWEMDELLQSDKMNRYSMAIEKAVLACTMDIAQLIELALVDKKTKH